MAFTEWVEKRRNWHTNPVNQGAVTGGLPLGAAAYSLASPSGSYSVAAGWQVLSVTALPSGSRFGVRRPIPVIASGGSQLRIQARKNAEFPSGVRGRVYVDFTRAAGGLETKSIAWTTGDFDEVIDIASDVVSAQFFVWLEPVTSWSGSASIGVAWFSLEDASTSNGVVVWAGTANTDLEQYRWIGTANDSASVYETREVIPVIPVYAPGTADILYGDRVTSYRWEVLSHSNGVDQLVGILDGVSDGSLTWVQNAAVKGGGKAQVVDLDVAAAGMMRIADLALESVRLRPVCVIQGLPENPLGVFLISSASEAWEDTGRVWDLELLDKCTVPSQDLTDQSYAVPAGALILQTVKSILAGCGEFIAINDSSTIATSSGMVWEAGTSKLKIINDLLDAAGYNALWVGGYGNFQLTPRVLPADRSITYEVLGIQRELVDGEQSIYRPDWNRERDSFKVPNKVIAVQAADGDDTGALVGQWTNEDPTSPYSYISRGRWITHVLTDVDVPDLSPADTVTFLQQRARATLIQMSSVQAQVKVTHLPIPVRVSDVLRFAHKRAKVDDRHVITRIQLDTSPLGLMQTNLQEVIAL